MSKKEETRTVEVTYCDGCDKPIGMMTFTIGKVDLCVDCVSTLVDRWADDWSKAKKNTKN